MSNEQLPKGSIEIPELSPEARKAAADIAAAISQARLGHQMAAGAHTTWAADSLSKAPDGPDIVSQLLRALASIGK